MQNRRNDGHEGYRKGAMQDWRDAGKEECRKVGMQDIRDERKEECRKGEMQEMRDANLVLPCTNKKDNNFNLKGTVFFSFDPVLFRFTL